MNYITYRFKLYKLNFQRKLSEKSILNDIAEARKNRNEETLERLHALLNANIINYDKNKYKLLTRYFLSPY